MDESQVTKKRFRDMTLSEVSDLPLDELFDHLSKEIPLKWIAFFCLIMNNNWGCALIVLCWAD